MHHGERNASINMQRRNIYIPRDNCYLYLGHMTQHKYSYLNIWSQTTLFWILALSLLGFVNVNRINYQWFSLVLYHLTVYVLAYHVYFSFPHYRMLKLQRDNRNIVLVTHAEPRCLQRCVKPCLRTWKLFDEYLLTE